MAEPDPIVRFQELFARARQTEPDVPEAMTLATVDVSGQPSARVVLLKGIDDRGFEFFTNFNSRKAQELEGNPRAAICFHFKTQREQVRVEGRVERLSAQRSDEYFASRPQGSQLAAVASAQSEPLANRAALDQRFAELKQSHGDGPVPRPENWGGYRLVAERIEFWSHRDNRLHDRVLYRRQNDAWATMLLNP